MKRINYQEYNSSMGTLIDLEDENTFKLNHKEEAINMPYNKLIYN